MSDTTTASPADAGRWGRIPAWWLDHPDLDADGLAVLAALATYADETGTCWPSQSTLAAKLKRSRPTVNRIRQRLHDLGLVDIERRHGRDGASLSCLYRLHFLPGTAMSRAAPTVFDVNGEPGRGGPDRDDSPPHTPRPQASQQQVHSEQTPDSPAGAGSSPNEVPADWQPAADDLEWAAARFGHVDLARHVEGFLLRCRAHGYRYRDVGAAWRAWLAQDAAAGKVPPAAAPARVNHGTRSTASAAAAERRVDAWAAAAARLRRPSVPSAWS
ncbi:helix-turn-helix domain-containing protein [Azospirillum halopraeferens]|uniref:helix-turn-helix domain-containing protein n=1 Tax=Azospirillum halopraeferens TaxID=34010 RepID=UPI0003FC8C54|nr:helix-turn-helix domain-containing protein [Azospirillum halopraeferens]